MLFEAIELQQRAVDQLVEKSENLREITFRAPTGSGKTYMMADYMNRILSDEDDVIFLVSTLSKGDLAAQNHAKFLAYAGNGSFPNLKSHLINTAISGEERLFIPCGFNVYLLPRDLYKSGGRLMQGAMEDFLRAIMLPPLLGGLGKRIILIKDECHIATNNLDSISAAFFDKVINFSATPNLKRGQIPDVEIKDEDAVNASLIKRIELGDEEERVEDALRKFADIKKQYRNLLGVNPCMIIQISNKEKADFELSNRIFPALNKTEFQDLKWMLIVDKDAKCDTNDVFKAKKLPVSKWKEYAKENTSGIDVIIFKMVISEGWDIPRACMLYQVRATQSDQLDEQVTGRVRRNPRLLDFETLSAEAKKLATTAWVWGVMPEGKRKSYCVKLCDESSVIKNEFQIKTTKLKNLTDKKGFDLPRYLCGLPDKTTSTDIFTLYKRLSMADESLKTLCYDYADSYTKWWKFNEYLTQIKQENEKFECDYRSSMVLDTDAEGNPILHSLPSDSAYVDNGNYFSISDWIWKRKDGKEKFSFDSEAEREWASVLKDLTSISVGTKRAVMDVKVGKPNQNAGVADLFGTVQPERMNETVRYLWAKNYISGSEIRYEYYLDGLRTSYPDFVLKDAFGRIHIFEVKSVNISHDISAGFDQGQYLRKIDALKKCYQQASVLTGHIFYFPILDEETWKITQFVNGEERTLTKDQFIQFVIVRMNQ